MAQAGWTVQDRSAFNFTAGPGEANYGLLVGQQLVGVVEAGVLDLVKDLPPAAWGTWPV